MHSFPVIKRGPTAFKVFAPRNNRQVCSCLLQLRYVSWIYHGSESGVATMSHLASVTQVTWLILNFLAAFCRVSVYSDGKVWVSGLAQDIEGLISAGKLLEFDLAQAVPTSSLFYLRLPLSSLPSPTSSQTSMADPFSRVSTIATAPVVSFFDTSAPASVVGGSPAAGLSSAVVPISVDLGADSFSSTGVALAGRSPTLFWFFALPLSPVPVRSWFWLDRCMVVPVMLVRWIPLPFIVSWPPREVSAMLPAVSWLPFGLSSFSSQKRATSSIRLCFFCMFHFISQVCPCWRQYLGWTLWRLNFPFQ